MKRRNFISFIGTTVFAGIASPRRVYAQAARNSQQLVGTPEMRFRYLVKMLKLLCTDLGPHPTGSPEYEKASRIIKKEIDLALPVTELDEYRFEKWEIVGESEFLLGDTRLETYLCHGCGGTPAGGIIGVLKKRNGSYEVTDKFSGKILASVSVSSYGRAIPHHSNEREMPVFGIGKYDIPLLESAVANQTTVRASAQVRFVPETPSWNVVGTLPGKRKDEILVLAHADTVYTSPGANDNTASVITMLMLAHAFSGTRPDFTLTFIATGSEEYGYLGAIHYAKRREEAGTMKNIKFIIQFDSLTYGPDFLLTSKDRELQALVQAINGELKITGTPRLIDSDAYVMDASPFVSSGARSIYINSRGYDGVTLPVYHRPEDIPETVGSDCVENSFRVFTEYIRRLQSL